MRVTLQLSQKVIYAFKLIRQETLKLLLGYPEQFKRLTKTLGKQKTRDLSRVYMRVFS